MIQYIYFVKCPNCEDEHFDFFDDAKGFALGCLSKKPIITQTEICRNDFGECTDSSDLGTVWSWEDECKDCQEPVAEPTFTKDEIVADYKPDTDPEFIDDDSDFRFVNDMTESLNGEDLDEVKKLCDEIGIITMYDLHSFMKETGATDETLVAKLREYRDELGPDFKIKESRKPVPEGMTIEQLVEEMEENEDEVECTWCNDLFPKDMCRKEVNLGWLCSRCADGIMSRGEKLAFVENNYWDFLDEDAGPRDPFDHHDPEYDEDEAADYMADLIDGAKDTKYDDAIDSLDESRDPFDHHDIDYDDEVSADYLSYLSDKAQDEKYDDAIDSLDEGYNPSEEVELYYDDLTITVYGDRRDVDDWDESEHSGEYTYSVRKGNVANIIWENFITEEDVADVPGGLETLEDNYEWFKFLETHFDTLFDKYYKDILKYYEEDAAEEFQDNYEPDDGPDPDAAYDAWRDEQLD